MCERYRGTEPAPAILKRFIKNKRIAWKIVEIHNDRPDRPHGTYRENYYYTQKNETVQGAQNVGFCCFLKKSHAVEEANSWKMLTSRTEIVQKVKLSGGLTIMQFCTDGSKNAIPIICAEKMEFLTWPIIIKEGKQ